MVRIILLFMFLIPASAWCEPTIAFQTENHNFGTVRPGDKLEFVFEFSNAGTDQLVVSRVSPYS
jgi:Protein of unknown function (DUF1573)